MLYKKIEQLIYHICEGHGNYKYLDMLDVGGQPVQVLEQVGHSYPIRE